MSKDKPLFDPIHPSLTEKEMRAAVADLVKYPKVIRSETDQVPLGQSAGLVSFRFFPAPYTMKNGKIAYGLMKLRGNYGSEEQCLLESSKIIRDVDSADSINIAPVGSWMFITNGDTFCKKNVDVKMNEEEVVMRDSALLEKRKKDDAIKSDLEERVQRLRDEKDIHDDPSSLKYYCMKRVVEANLKEEIEKKKKMIEEHDKKHKDVLKHLKKLETQNPGHKHEWIDMYNSERKTVGLCAHIITEKEALKYEEDMNSVQD